MPRLLALVPLLVALAQAGCLDKSSEHRIRANAFLRGGDAKAAVAECDEGLALKKDDPALLILKGKSLFELDDLDASKAAYLRALEVAGESDPRGMIEAHVGVAMVASRKGDWPLARTHFEAVVKADQGKSASSHLNLARACIALKDMDCAISHAETAGHLAGNEEATLYTLGTVYLAADKFDEADKTFQHICDVVPSAASCPYGVAMVAAKKGDKPKALAKLKEALDRKVPDPARIPSETAFAAIKDDPEFQALIASATK